MCTHAVTVPTQLLNKEASTHRSTTGLFIQTQEADVLIIVNEIKQEAISHTSCSRRGTSTLVL